MTGWLTYLEEDDRWLTYLEEDDRMFSLARGAGDHEAKVVGGEGEDESVGRVHGFPRPHRHVGQHVTSKVAQNYFSWRSIR